jgi:GNAT superfamily N-acetyltransferase
MVPRKGHALAAKIEITEEEPASLLDEYSRIPISFEVRSVMDVDSDDPVTATLTERQLEVPWTKDYDRIEGEGPTSWAGKWNISNWGVLVARLKGSRVGGCVLAYNTDGVNRLEGRDDIAILWDLRVHPDYRGQGIGKALFDAAVAWALRRDCIELRIETQNINAWACRFYQKQGCRLHSINRDAYEDFPEEVELIWSLRLRNGRTGGSR